MAKNIIKFLVIIAVFFSFVKVVNVNAAIKEELLDDPMPTVHNSQNFTCQNDDIRKAVNIVATVLLWLRILVPVFLVVTSMISFGKAVISQDESKVQETFNILIKKVAIGAAVFFIPLIIITILKYAVHSYNTIDDSWVYCVDLLK